MTVNDSSYFWQANIVYNNVFVIYVINNKKLLLPLVSKKLLTIIDIVGLWILNDFTLFENVLSYKLFLLCNTLFWWYWESIDDHEGSGRFRQLQLRERVRFEVYVSI